jgi:hypothetical protein
LSIKFFVFYNIKSFASVLELLSKRETLLYHGAVTEWGNRGIVGDVKVTSLEVNKLKEVR